MSTKQPTTTVHGPWRRFLRWLPDHVDRRVRIAAWASLILEIAIVGTGGAVRLTDSGLGCEWPLCTPDSLFPTAAQSYHSLIEFGNRGLSFFVGLAAVVVIVLISQIRAQRRDLWAMAWTVFAGVLLQGIVGGILVLFDLRPNLVSFHYVVSIILVGVTAAFIARMRRPIGPRALVVPRWLAAVTYVAALALAVTVVIGVLTTGAGPHSGDAEVTLRNGFDATLLEHVHAWPAYTLFALTVVLVIGATTLREPVPALRTRVVALLIVELVQIGVGLYQARHALPPLAVGVHMVLAAIAVATMVAVVFGLTRPVAAATARTSNA